MLSTSSLHKYFFYFSMSFLISTIGLAQDSGDNICIDPAKYLCNEKNNPYIGLVRKAHLEFERIEKAASDSISVKLCQKYYGEKCERKIEENMKHIYTSERMKKVEKIFTEGKTLLKQFLFNHYKSYSPDSSKAFTLIAMMESVDKLKLAFGAAPGSGRSTWNAFYFENKVYVQGLILLVDQIPESIEDTIYHEISHAAAEADPDIFRELEYKKRSPFFNQINCLKNEHSVGAKSTDIDCFVNHPKVSSDYINLVIDEIRANPDKQVQPIPPDCQQGQSGEAFADWVAVELLWSQNKKTSLLNIQDEVLKQNAMFCEVTWYESGKTRGTNKNPHPLFKDRINSIFFAHPKSLDAFSCSKNSLKFYNPEKNLTNFNEEDRLYCGSSDQI